MVEGVDWFDKSQEELEEKYWDVHTGEALGEEVNWVDDSGKNKKQYWDDVTGEELDSKMANKARRDEMDEVRKHRVYVKVPIKQCWDSTGKAPIKTKWIDLNKGDQTNPEYRSRLVAKEIAYHKRDDLFAATPPLEALKIVLSLAVTEGIGFQTGHGKNGMKIDFVDIRRAYFHADARREVYVELPAEDEEEGMCGQLSKSMYGTRDAAQNWEKEYQAMATSCGFVTGKATPCVFFHPERKLRMTVHGDDFTILGYEEDLNWLRSQMSARWECKFRGRLGPAPEDDKSIRVLNRIFEWCEDGIRIEPDQRHAEIITKLMGVDQGNSVSSPGVKQELDEDGEEDLLEPREQTKYRAVAARANYLAQDRSDLQYSVKECSRHQANPNREGLEKIKRLARYLVKCPRWTIKFKYQQNTGSINAYVDTDFAGCRRTRRSTSGGLVMLGGHMVKSWSSNQAVIALSSGEAEYYGIVKGASIGLGTQSILTDLGCDAKLVVWTDATAAKGIATRRGLGKVRHIHTRELWLQEKLADGALEIAKVKGEDNPADALTKYLDQGKLAKHMVLIGAEVRGDRHPDAPHVDPNAVVENNVEEEVDGEGDGCNQVNMRRRENRHRDNNPKSCNPSNPSSRSALNPSVSNPLGPDEHNLKFMIKANKRSWFEITEEELGPFES